MLTCFALFWSYSAMLILPSWFSWEVAALSSLSSAILFSAMTVALMMWRAAKRKFLSGFPRLTAARLISAKSVGEMLAEQQLLIERRRSADRRRAGLAN